LQVAAAKARDLAEEIISYEKVTIWPKLQRIMHWAIAQHFSLRMLPRRRRNIRRLLLDGSFDSSTGSPWKRAHFV
jgi:hypothetical protein